MVCDVCKFDAPFSQSQLQRRQEEINRNRIGIFPCPECGGTDYMLSEINIGKDPPRVYEGILMRKSRRPIVMTKQLKQPPSSLWKRLLNWWRK